MSAAAGASGQGGGRGPEPGARPQRLIRGDSTMEIPLHLLFRDDAVGSPVPLTPSVVGRRRGTGEQPRTPAHRPPPTPRGAPRAPVLRERGARALPGALGLLMGAVGLAGCVLGLWWAGALPPSAVRVLGLPRAGAATVGGAQWAALAGAGALAVTGFCGISRGATGTARVLTLFGRYRGSVRRAGLVWVNPLLVRRRADVRLRHWRSGPLAAVDADGVGVRVAVLVVWRVRDTARALLGVDDHEGYLRACVEAATARVCASRPMGPQEPGRSRADTLRDVEGVGEVLTRLLAAETEAAGIEVCSVRPLRVDYAPEVAEAMRERGVAALEARHRESGLDQVIDSVEDTVTRLALSGLVELDEHERKTLVRDLTVAFSFGALRAPGKGV
ncbi:SPFH domain-containing protein [Streptomyces sp. NPDC050560]|uniref:SPFH domain-containing protein n=1 Tax=Streptomyces sp. NPDC050560 TaxID=3365630 RepID=UPI0037AC1A73